MSMWYDIENVNEIDSPALLIYPHRVKENIKRVIAMAGNAGRLRPHIKTHKSPEITKLMVDAGIRKFKCSTIAEAEMLAMAGVEDILLAYQLNEVKIQRFVKLIKNMVRDSPAYLIMMLRLVFINPLLHGTAWIFPCIWISMWV